MENTVFIKVCTNRETFNKTHLLKMDLESLVTLFIYKCCLPKQVNLIFIYENNNAENEELFTIFHDENISFIELEQAPWQVTSCIFPVIKHDDLIITGLCAVARHICKFMCLSLSVPEHEEGLLGFRHSCLQAPNETSVWTKFCEVDIVKTVKDIISSNKINILPLNLVRFENHLKKPVKVHNIYKLARDIKKENLKTTIQNSSNITEGKDTTFKETTRMAPKIRKWKSNIKKQLEVDSSTSIEELNISHQFSEGPFLTLADLILYPNYHIICQSLGEDVFKSLLPFTYKWYQSIQSIPELKGIKLLDGIKIKSSLIDDISVPNTEDVSLYKSDPKRHNPKRRLYTKEIDIEAALCALIDGMEMSVSDNNLEFNTIKWETVPDGANPTAGHLPDERMARKTQQLENMTLAVLNVAKEGDLIVDFCSGSGHLGILIAHLLPNSTVILLENKEQSLLRARKRVKDIGLKNVYFFQCNLDFFIGKFDLGIALHACGVASDLVLDKCLKANAKFVLCPCCYGSLHATDRFVYPRSCKFSPVSIDKYLCIGHAADQTHEDHPLTVRGARCMVIIDSDRAHLAEEFGYTVTLSKLKPLTCTPKNNLLIGVPS